MENKIELGSEYNITLSELSVAHNNLFYYLETSKYELLDSGRSAIKCIRFPTGKILLPEFICESVIKCFHRENILFYKIKKNFIIDMEDLKNKINRSVSVIFFAHYFGSCQPECIRKELREIAYKRKILLVEDATQSLFSLRNITGDFLVASVRKWLPVPMGGLICSEKYTFSDLSALKKNQDNERACGMILKDMFLRGKLESNTIYRKIFSECESKLDEQKEVYRISDFAKYIISCNDIKSIVSRRKMNYKALSEGLQKQNIMAAVSLSVDECPLAFTLRVPDRDKFRKYLMEHRIYCAVHWPFDGICGEEREQARKNGDELISLPIDQRYGIEHMEYLIKIIKRYKGELLF